MGLKGVRDHRRLSYRIIARETGVPIKTVIAIADNSIQMYPADALAALCDYFDCEPGDILGFTDMPDDQIAAGRRLAFERRMHRINHVS